MNTVQSIGTVAVVALALGLALVIPSGGHVTTSSTVIVSPTTTSLGSNGLVLRLSANDTSITQGQFLAVNVSEYNSLGTINNVSESGNWLVHGSTQSCPNQAYPFGISLFQGHYTAGNVTQGTAVQIFPITACPMFLRLITGYVFQPQSVNATVLPGGSATTAMDTVVSVGLNFTSFGPAAQNTPLSPGSYTLTASDEWGSVAFLYITVQQ